MAIDPRWSKRLAIISMAVGLIVICATVNVDGLIDQIWANNIRTGNFGRRNTVPEIVERLSGESIAAIDETDFDNLYMVVVPRWWGRTKVVRLKYGPPT